jgi:hypothetical protein
MPSCEGILSRIIKETKLKACSICGESKPLSDFHSRKGTPDGKRKDCKDCKRARDKRYYHSTPNMKEKTILRLRAWRETWTEEKREQERERSREYARKNPDVLLRNTRKRTAQKLLATPAWAKEEFEEFLMQEIYHYSALLKKTTGIAYEVDHIVPLRSDYVCGLHCPANLQIIEKQANRSKNNHYWPNMWENM